MSLGLCVLVRDRQDSICVRFARAGLFCAGSPFLCRIGRFLPGAQDFVPAMQGSWANVYMMQTMV